MHPWAPPDAATDSGGCFDSGLEVSYCCSRTLGALANIADEHSMYGCAPTPLVPGACLHFWWMAGRPLRRDQRLYFHMLPGVSFHVRSQVSQRIVRCFAVVTSRRLRVLADQGGDGAYVDDSVITTKVEAAILGELRPEVLPRSTSKAFKGVVQLSGFVNSREDMDAAIRVARNVNGVTSVKNDMQLK